MLASVIRQVISPVLRGCPPECGIVSITDIEVSRDFSYATVYISSLNEVGMAMKYFKKKTKELQQDLGSLYRKRIPALRFRIDPRTERGEHMDGLLQD